MAPKKRAAASTTPARRSTRSAEATPTSRTKRAAPTKTDDEDEPKSKKAKTTATKKTAASKSGVATKSKRGRPPKAKVEIEVETEVDAEVEVPKRGRGRPPTKKQEEEEENSDKPKRGRGRPSMKKQEEDEEISDKPKRGRGRPPTKKAEEEEEVSDEPKRRGRPPKSGNEASSQVPNTEGGHQKAVKGRRGKAAHAPKQLPLGEQQNQEEASEQLIEEAAAESSKRKRGRPAQRSKLMQDLGVEIAPRKATTGGKKRGRPSKNISETMAAAIEDDEEAEVEARAKRAKPSPAAERKSTKKAVSSARKTNDNVAEVDDADEHGRHFWLMKSEPESRLEKGHDVKFSFEDLKACTEPEPWTGVRNHTAKNNMLAMRVGDLAFFYHSSCKVPAIVGIAEIVEEATPDETAFDPKHPYYNEKSDRSKPTWYNVHVEYRADMPNIVTLNDLKEHKTDTLSQMQMFTQSRLSVSKVTKKEWDFIMDLVGAETPDPRPSTGRVESGHEEKSERIGEGSTTVGEVISEAKAAAAHVVTDVVDIVKGLLSPGRPVNATKSTGGFRTKSASPGPTKQIASAHKRSKSAQPLSALATVDEDGVAGAVPPSFVMRSSPPIEDGQGTTK